MESLSVTSVALKTAVPGMVECTVKLTTPEALEGLEAGEIASAAPRLEVRVTDLPKTGLPLASCKLTEMVVVPSAGSESGEAMAVDVSALTAPPGGLTLTLSMRSWSVAEEVLPVISMIELVLLAVTSHVRFVKV